MYSKQCLSPSKPTTTNGLWFAWQGPLDAGIVNLLLSALLKLWEFPNSISISNLNVNNHQLFTLSWQNWFLSAKYPLQIQHLQFTIRRKKTRIKLGFNMLQLCTVNSFDVPLCLTIRNSLPIPKMFKAW